MPGGDPRARARLSTFRRRILLAQSLCALAALICLISTQASVARPLPNASTLPAVAPRRDMLVAGAGPSLPVRVTFLPADTGPGNTAVKRVFRAGACGGESGGYG